MDIPQPKRADASELIGVIEELGILGILLLYDNVTHRDSFLISTKLNLADSKVVCGTFI